MATLPGDLSPAALDFLTVRHLATLTTLRPDGSLHVVPVGFTWEPETSIARVITNRASRKARNALVGCPAVLCQVDGRYWLSLQGEARILDDEASVEDAVRRYAARYREPRPNPERVVIAIDVRSVLGNV
ncbi:MAG: pyridoxamine 5-phosphate oxidase-related FMN-binding [Humibacillus sp.]|nr:pyridoxamine 5-phosphate oxidase-related FMN-binding [Humibacillus sp.]